MIIGNPVNTSRNLWTPTEETTSGVYTSIISNSSGVATIIDPLEISGYYGDTFASDAVFTNAANKQGVTVLADMSTIGAGTGAIFHAFASAFNTGPSDLVGIAIYPEGAGLYTIQIGNPFDSMNQVELTGVAITGSDNITVAVDNTGAESATTYCYKNGALLGSHENNTTFTNPLELFLTLISCESPAITLTVDADYSVTGVTNFGSSGNGNVDPASYPAGRKNTAFEVSGLASPLLSTKGIMDNGNIAYFDFSGALNYVGGLEYVETVTSSSGAIVVNSTDPLNPVLSIKSDGPSSDYLNASGTYTTVTVPVQSIVGGTSISVTESPTGTFTIANTAPNINTVVAAGTNSTVTESPTNTFTVDSRFGLEVWNALSETTQEIAAWDDGSYSFVYTTGTTANSDTFTRETLAETLSQTSVVTETGWYFKFPSLPLGTLSINADDSYVAIRAGNNTNWSEFRIRVSTDLGTYVAGANQAIVANNSAFSGWSNLGVTINTTDTYFVGYKETLGTPVFILRNMTQSQSTSAVMGGSFATGNLLNFKMDYGFATTTPRVITADLNDAYTPRTYADFYDAVDNGTLDITSIPANAENNTFQVSTASPLTTSGGFTIKTGDIVGFNSTNELLTPLTDTAYTTAVIPDSTNKRYVNDAQLVVIGNTSGTNTGDQDLTTLQSKQTTTVSSVAGVVTIDLSAVYTRYVLTLTENVTSWVFTNVPASGYFKEICIEIIQHASSAKTVVTPATSTRTAGGLPWVASTVLSSVEVLMLQCMSDSTRTLYPTGVMA